ncbi:MAG: hypothetical protein QOK37_3802 [Thermoanaerobaculia bacterium]|nr:hypothetical protein [Thermoanaerobaculia bacterium]
MSTAPTAAISICGNVPSVRAVHQGWPSSPRGLTCSCSRRRPLRFHTTGWAIIPSRSARLNCGAVGRLRNPVSIPDETLAASAGTSHAKSRAARFHETPATRELAQRLHVPVAPSTGTSNRRFLAAPYCTSARAKRAAQAGTQFTSRNLARSLSVELNTAAQQAVAPDSARGLAAARALYFFASRTARVNRRSVGRHNDRSQRSSLRRRRDSGHSRRSHRRSVVRLRQDIRRTLLARDRRPTRRKRSRIPPRVRGHRDPREGTHVRHHTRDAGWAVRPSWYRARRYQATLDWVCATLGPVLHATG